MMSPFIAGVVAQLRALGHPRIELPRVGLTLLPPWGYAICRKGKRCENRAPSVAGRLRNWRGVVALTHSANWNKGDYNDAVDDLLLRGLFEQIDVAACAAWSEQMMGKVFAAAELIDVRPNGDDPSNDWAVPVEHGLWLGGVIELEPMACIVVDHLHTNETNPLTVANVPSRRCSARSSGHWLVCAKYGMVMANYWRWQRDHHH